MVVVGEMWSVELCFYWEVSSAPPEYIWREHQNLIFGVFLSTFVSTMGETYVPNGVNVSNPSSQCGFVGFGC